MSDVLTTDFDKYQITINEKNNWVSLWMILPDKQNKVLLANQLSFIEAKQIIKKLVVYPYDK